MKNFTLIHIIAFFLFIFSNTVQGQIVITKPNLVRFTQACASDSFNSYSVTFSFSPDTGISASNQFILELSDADGSFANAEVVYTSGEGEIVTTPATITFAVPETVSGESYKVRVKSTSPSATSSGSNAFPAYYKLQDSPFTINNLVETANFCSGGSYLLTIDDPGDENNDSPLQYPSLTYNWFRETSATTKEFVANGASLAVSTPGKYFVETNYGTCTSNSYSNRVTVYEISTGVVVTVNSSLGNPYCMSDGPTTLTSTEGDAYQWSKDGELIDGATEQTYTTNDSGEYSVNVDLGSCTTSASILLDNSGFSSSIDGVDLDEDNVLEDDDSLLATITTDATNPSYAWYRNDVQLSDETSNSLEIDEFGSYRAVVSQPSSTGGCIASNEFVFTVSGGDDYFPDVAEIPNIVSPNGDGINDTWIIPKEYVAGTNTEVLIISAQGKTVLQTTDYLNNWPEDAINFENVNPVYYYIITPSQGSVRKGSITVIK
ncbi:gliding motility-associated C-terminal domain-containing protein [Tamlana haliotis]|uniref:Gliding motility-associated C-terminal domain-containing protein n=1 Tax=Pseudotamlana haliotis TaxID=2614804 RepID=A0A6N6MDB9_9FLAO|nr:gliding motility-associated C-terminal domain-containing protein [Tamlana haliotis]KAB1067308.1 gliding motility-associated C-terminal domain-containing protein [Tamlana haliotis]